MWCTESRPVTVETFDTPEKPHALVPENTSLQLDWKAPSNVHLIRFWFELQKVHLTVHFLQKFYLFIFLAALGLLCCVWAFSSCGERGLLFVAVHRFLIAVASLVAEHGL